MRSGYTQLACLGVVFLLTGVSTAQIPLRAMQGMMRSTVRTSVAAPRYEFIWATAESNRNWTGAALSADGRRQTALVQWGSIYVSTNYGVTWSAKDVSRSWECVAMSADGARQTACVYDGGMYFSTDYGATWAAGGESLCWVSVAMSADGARQTAAEDNGYVYVSSDYGATWTARHLPFHDSGGGPNRCARVLRYRHLQLRHQLSASVLSESPPCPISGSIDPLWRVRRWAKQFRRAAGRDVHNGAG